MASFPAQNIVQARLSFLVGTRVVSTTMHWAATVAMVQVDLQNLSDAIDATILPPWRNMLATDCIYQGTDLRLLLKDTLNPVASYSSGQAGLYAGQALPPNLSFVMQLRQAEVDSNGNNRLYIAGLPEVAVTNSLVNAGFMTGEALTFANTLIAPLVDSSTKVWALVAVRRWAAGVPVAPEGYAVSQCNPTRAIGTQRRRRTNQLQYSL